LNKKIFIITGEASGESHTVQLIRQIKLIKTDIELSAIGGDLLKNEGVDILQNYNEINFTGFSSVIKNLLKLNKSIKHTVEYIRKVNPDIIILVDFPGYNLKIAEKIRNFYNGKIIYYISPQIWAWHKSRIKTIKKTIDKMLVVFPFETEFYKKEGVEAEFTGHPLKNKIVDFLKLNTKNISTIPVISLLPGSRLEEIKRILPALLETTKKFGDNIKINLICSNNIDLNIYKKYINSYKVNLISHFEDEKIKFKTIQDSDLIFTKSGTSTLECALIGTPCCVVYNTTWFNYFIGKMFITIEYFSIINILRGKKVVNELIQKDFTTGKLYEEGIKILNDENYRNTMLNEFKHLKEDLFFSEKEKSAAEIICKFIK
jgi:lipid-A-disaccharide synthase